MPVCCAIGRASAITDLVAVAPDGHSSDRGAPTAPPRATDPTPRMPARGPSEFPRPLVSTVVGAVEFPGWIDDARWKDHDRAGTATTRSDHQRRRPTGRAAG